MKKNKKVIAIVGATASGKTAYSIELARKIDGEIISADSRLVYKGFDIGTAKPTIDERAGIPHHLLDVVEPEVDYSVGLWVKEAERIIDEIHTRGKTPIIASLNGVAYLGRYHYSSAQDKSQPKCATKLKKMLRV